MEGKDQGIFSLSSTNKFYIKTNILHFGTHGLQALEKGRISAKQIEAVRRTITNFLKRKSKNSSKIKFC